MPKLSSVGRVVVLGLGSAGGRQVNFAGAEPGPRSQRIEVECMQQAVAPGIVGQVRAESMRRLM